MEKIRLGGHVFREKPTDKEPHTIEKYCVVIAKNLDGTAKLCVFDPDGKQFVLDRAELVQRSDDMACHYEEFFGGVPPAGATSEELPDAPPAKQVGKSPDADDDDEYDDWQASRSDHPSTVPGGESAPSAITPEVGAEHAGIK